MTVDEKGSAGLMAVWAAGTVVAFAVTAVVWGGVVTARHRAGRTADLAALAAARAAVGLGGTDPCSAAVRLAAETAPAARVSSCALLDDGSAYVVVEVPALTASGGLIGRLAADLPPARGRARAGAR